ncbi:MAG: hypothetical protein IPL63_19025 [Saprospiraceae bacterium]|nr:hypothetical protein [Saprospiraceae bacterium]MBK6566629.1 hypothetical protein [Saprospiraceae bacterium]MBK6567192.1 hypothetical protein [Saprospiraceae bacterium]MBK7525615.1 hypothetical protein [Saprospiraceae bacterium]MBK8081094.1 hypothetical protein [Saprospiraceae bacterium]
MFIIISFIFLNGCQLIQNHETYMNKNGLVIYHPADSVIVFYPNTPFKVVFIKSQTKGQFCVDSYHLACYDNNRNTYKSCLFLEPTSKHEIKVSSDDSCTNIRINDDSGKFIRIPFEGNKVQWDSIRVSVSDYITTNVRTIGFTEARNIRYNNHPFTAEQEVYFLCNSNFGPILAESSKHVYYKFEIFYKGNKIVMKEGDILPSIFKSLLLNYKYINRN